MYFKIIIRQMKIYKDKNLKKEMLNVSNFLSRSFLLNTLSVGS